VPVAGLGLTTAAVATVGGEVMGALLVETTTSPAQVLLIFTA